jgi:hypothetical protein
MNRFVINLGHAELDSASFLIRNQVQTDVTIPLQISLLLYYYLPVVLKNKCPNSNH